MMSGILAGSDMYWIIRPVNNLQGQYTEISRHTINRERLIKFEQVAE